VIVVRVDSWMLLMRGDSFQVDTSPGPLRCRTRSAVVSASKGHVVEMIQNSLFLNQNIYHNWALAFQDYGQQFGNPRRI
jgi:hypothetical protein